VKQKQNATSDGKFPRKQDKGGQSLDRKKALFEMQKKRVRAK